MAELNSAEAKHLGAPVREVVYLSTGKLNEFVPEPRRALPAVKFHAGGSFAGVDVASPVSDSVREMRRHLARVEKRMGRDTPWYTEPGLAPGCWVRFEAALDWVTLPGRYQDLVLFVDSVDSSGPGFRRLLLHGSARHLRGGPPVQVEGPALTGFEGGHSAGTIFVTQAGRVVSALAPEATSGPLSRNGIRDLLAALDSQRPTVSTAARVNGLARVSALLPAAGGDGGCLVASPLIVEYVK
ncbi:SAVMC3_10250 family protein [Salinispora vitiensis]|uniref:SAVMC3_10250 family protein n=1 Tax=Salinispora vitiensis TaxID=999544 RepID=UPI00036EA694|nr:SAVMC3_10250 family protein [Salinispora vitiensis]